MDAIAEHGETYFYMVAFQSEFQFFAKCELVTMRHLNLPVILAPRDVCVLKAMTLQATHKVGGSFLPPMSATIGYNLRRIGFHLVVLAPKTVSSVPLCSASNSKMYTATQRKKSPIPA